MGAGSMSIFSNSAAAVRSERRVTDIGAIGAMAPRVRRTLALLIAGKSEKEAAAGMQISRQRPNSVSGRFPICRTTTHAIAATGRRWINPSNVTEKYIATPQPSTANAISFQNM